MTPETPLTIDQVKTPEGHHLVIAGDLDYTTAPDLEATLKALPLAEDEVLTLDLTDITFCDSTGLSTLIAAQRLAENSGGRIAVTAIDGSLARVMAITGVEHLFGMPTTDLDAQENPGSLSAEA